MARVLVIDDDAQACDALVQMAKTLGHTARSAFALKEGFQLASEEAFDLVFLDVGLPDGSGLEALPEFIRLPSEPEVVIVTGASSPEGAEMAIKTGAWDYIEKPFSFGTVRLPLMRALQFREHKRAKGHQVLGKEGVRALKRPGIAGNSPPIKTCLDLVAQAAGGVASVLIRGETGTGKEIFARAVHENSDRATRPFVVVDCAALTETLIESVLFGYKRGAFTGADKAHDGMVKQADGGTLFLDEVGEMPLQLQKAFLRVLQEKRFRPVGGKVEEGSDFRLITATNRDLEAMVREGLFRKDLFFRVAALEMVLPPLRERIEDVKEIARHHTDRFCERYGIGTKGFSPDFVHALRTYPWPGNVRELVHSLETAVLAAYEEPLLFIHHLPVHIRAKVVSASVGHKSAVPSVVLPAASPPPPAPPAPCPCVELSMEEDAPLRPLREIREAAVARVEKEYLTRLIRQHGESIRNACEVSGLSRPHLYALLKKHSIRR